MKPSIPCPDCGSSPLQGPTLSRRAFVEMTAGGLAVSWFLKSPAAAFAAEGVKPGLALRNTAKNAIFIFCPGAPSQIDTWDLKVVNGVTPNDFAPTNMGGGLMFPTGLMPKMATHLGDVAIVRSCLAWALVHGLGQTWTQIARNPTGATGAIAPNIGAIAALELESRRAATDVLPGFVALNAGAGIVGAGYLPSTYSPFSVQPSGTAGTGLSTLQHPDGASRFALRYQDLDTLDAKLRATQAFGKEGADLAGFYAQAKILMDDSTVNDLFKYTTAEAQRYAGTTSGNGNAFGNSLVIARNLVRGRRGARFIQVNLGGWDMHANIYGTAGASLYTQMKAQLDPGLAALLDDLKATPGEEPGKTLLDETLVFVTGEFGRTVGALNGQSGRDHFLRFSSVFAGGGVKGGRVVGATDATGATLQDAGWSGGRDVRPEDVACTVYDALGIDYTTVRHDDPLNRGFEYVPYAKDGAYKPIETLF